MNKRKLLRFQYEILKIILCRHTDGFASFELFRYHFTKHRKELGITSQWVYLSQADAFFGGKAFPANHFGPPIGDPEECLRKYDYAIVRYNNQTNTIGYRHGNLVGTYFRPSYNYGKSF